MANKIRILIIGKAHDKTLMSAISEYEKRLKPYLGVGWQIIPPKTEATSIATVASESNIMLATLKEAEYVILLDELGTQMTSPEFSKKLTDSMASHKDITFIIGGAYGVSDALKKVTLSSAIQDG